MVRLIRLLRRKAKGKPDPEGDRLLAEAAAASAASKATNPWREAAALVASEAALSDAKASAYADVFGGRTHSRSADHPIMDHPKAELHGVTHLDV